MSSKKTNDAAKFNKKTLKILPLIILLLALVQFIFFKTKKDNKKKVG